VNQANGPAPARAGSPPTAEAAGPFDDPVVLAAVEEYLNALEAGCEPDREALLARHAQVAGALTGYLDALHFVHAAGSELDGSRARAKPEGAAAEEPIPSLGDFRILREIGRGGMGVVYEAQQLSLARRVALKILPFAAALDPRQQQRFKNEAQAAAQLHHPNIVPVHAIGCERGVHYYAMQFVEGQSLACLIRQLRGQLGTTPGKLYPGEAGSEEPIEGATAVAALTVDDSASELRGALVAGPATLPPAGLPLGQWLWSKDYFRAAARLGLQAAEALEHAHQVGVVHRDIKPANLLLDVRGNLWVADFGLAQVRGDTRLTMSGDLLGTLRYMSPEQVQGQRRLVDQRSDIYSLGTTLYELATLQPAFSQQDRQELLRRIALEDAPRPRRLNPLLPAELETILNKAMAKEPECRYASAGELVEDLRRFLEERPILARPPTVLQQTSRWLRRHRAVAASGVAMLVLAALSSLTIAWIVWREKGKTESALTEARNNYALALEQEQRAQAAYRVAHDSLERYYTTVSENRLLNKPGLQPLRKELLSAAAEFYRQLAENGQHDPKATAERALALFRLGYITAETTSAARGAELYREGIPLLEAVLDKQSNRSSYVSALASAYRMQGILCRQTGDPEAAGRALQHALELNRQLLAEDAGNAQYRREFARSILSLGILLEDKGQLDPAVENCQQAQESFDRLVKEHPDLILYRLEQADCANNLGLCYRAQGRRTQAEQALKGALGTYRQLKREHPEDPEFAFSIATVCLNLGVLQVESRRPAQAEEAYAEAAAVSQQLVQDNPTVMEYRAGLAKAKLNLGDLYLTQAQLKKAEACLQEAEELLAELARREPKIVEFQDSRAWALASLGTVYRQKKDFTRAEAAYREVITLRERLCREHPELHKLEAALGSVHGNRGNLLRESGRPLEALESFARAIRIQESIVSKHHDDALTRQALSNSYGGQALALVQLHRDAEAVPAWDRAIELDTGKHGPVSRIHRANTLVRLGENFRALADMDRLCAEPALPSDLLYSAAHVYALAAAASGHDSGAAPREQQAVREQAACQAVRVLARARQSGFFRSAANRGLLKKDKDLSALRSREDFQKLIEQIERQPDP
jgi:eukaryotic-like serine/threonine-protein kinase